MSAVRDRTPRRPGHRWPSGAATRRLIWKSRSWWRFARLHFESTNWRPAAPNRRSLTVTDGAST